jgi:hypothetical protein
MKKLTVITCAIAVCLSGLFVSPVVYAARPVITDDARIPNIHTDHSMLGNFYTYVPASFLFRDDRFVLHTNLGWLREKEPRQNRMTWGIGSETQLGRRTWLIAEVFGQDRGRPHYQAGFRYWLKLDRIQIDATYGNQFGTSTEDRLFSTGLRLLSSAFLP